MRVLLLVALLGCSRDDPSKITAPNDKSLPIAPAVDPESPMVTSIAPGAKAIVAPNSVGKPPANALFSSTGLASKQLARGNGTVHPKPTDKVRVRYNGWTTDGKMIDSSIVRDENVSFPLTAVIKGWSEGVQLMVVGEQRRFWIPSDLAYGDSKSAGTPRGMLVFDVELLAIEP